MTQFEMPRSDQINDCNAIAKSTRGFHNQWSAVIFPHHILTQPPSGLRQSMLKGFRVCPWNLKSSKRRTGAVSCAVSGFLERPWLQGAMTKRKFEGDLQHTWNALCNGFFRFGLWHSLIRFRSLECFEIHNNTTRIHEIHLDSLKVALSSPSSPARRASQPLVCRSFRDYWSAFRFHTGWRLVIWDTILLGRKPPQNGELW